MPTYDYRCQKCKKTFEYSQSMNDKPLTRCVYCKGKVERLIGAGAGFIFKGSGFYETDYKRKSDPGKSSEAKPAPAASPEKTPKPEPPAQKKETGKKKK